MVGTNLVVQSYVTINEGCPLAITKEGTDHVQIRCGGTTGDAFEIVVPARSPPRTGRTRCRRTAGNRRSQRGQSASMMPRVS